jgi:hypothetical protein
MFATNAIPGVASGLPAACTDHLIPEVRCAHVAAAGASRAREGTCMRHEAHEGTANAGAPCLPSPPPLWSQDTGLVVVEFSVNNIRDLRLHHP